MTEPIPPIWKILTPAEAALLLEAETFAGSADDVRDGFIHLSSEAQLAGTLDKHYAGRVGLVGARCDPARLGDALRWEASRGGQLFPHLYRPLALADVERLVPYAEVRLRRPGEAPGRAP